MENILITGAGGNVGTEVLKHFAPASHQRVWLGSRNQNASPDSLYFDFKDLPNSIASLDKIDVLFLLRPPDIADVKKYFAPLIHACKERAVKHIVFLSVQGADTASFIPHAKIEKLIVESAIPYTFIRPSYFMQNLTTMLLGDIKNKRRIFLPAGKAPFLWVDVADIGAAIAKVLEDVRLHQNKIYTITGSSLVNFGSVADLISNELKEKVTYISPNLIRFYFAKRREGMSSSYIFVMIMLHYIARFQKPPSIHPDFKLLVKRNPATLTEFIHLNRGMWARK